jgi:hypothetical protein
MYSLPNYGAPITTKDLPQVGGGWRWRRRDGSAPCQGKVIAMQNTGWHVIIEFDEDDRHTHPTATARVREDRPMTARGDAYRNPSDSNQPLVGEEIAAAKGRCLGAGVSRARRTGRRRRRGRTRR